MCATCRKHHPELYEKEVKKAKAKKKK